MRPTGNPGNSGKTHISCAMSGGVDSSVAALLLKEQGCEVIGVTMKLWDCFKTPLHKTCCSPADSLDAARVCEQLKIPHHIVDMREAFRREVVGYFVREYSQGRTPNPCIRCNELLKFGLLRDECRRLFGTDIIATGHYARIGPPLPHSTHSTAGVEKSTPAVEWGGGGRLLKGLDSSKDQSYFLFTLVQEGLDKTLFPIGRLKKEDVRRIAAEAGLKTAQKRESQEICFVPDGDCAGFINDYYPLTAKGRGDFVDLNGRVLGRHDGVHAYTIGQRRGLGFGVGRRQYVVKIDAAENRVVLGDNKDLMKKEMTVENVVMRPQAGAGARLRMTVRIRCHHKGGAAVVEPLGGGMARVIFDEPQRAITPGQAAVFYDGDNVLGGGWILGSGLTI